MAVQSSAPKPQTVFFPEHQQPLIKNLTPEEYYGCYGTYQYLLYDAIKDRMLAGSTEDIESFRTKVADRYSKRGRRGLVIKLSPDEIRKSLEETLKLTNG